jgi:phage FluMu gp28-like protein
MTTTNKEQLIRSPRSLSSKVWIEGLPKDQREKAVDAMCWVYPTWFFECLIEMEGGPLILEPFQVDYLLDQSTFKITNKSRQTGGSVQLAAAKFFKAYTTENYRCDIVSINLKEAADKITKIKAMWETLPLRYRKPLAIDNALSIGFHGSKSRMSVIHSQASSSGVRGSRKDIVFDEFAHIREAPALFDAALPAIMNGNLGVDIVSTPMGKHNLFAQIWLNEENDRGEHPWEIFSRHEFIWLDTARMCIDPEAAQREWNDPRGINRDYHQMDYLINKYGNQKMKAVRNMRPMDYILQEYCGYFTDDSYALFPYDLLMKVFKPTIGELEDQKVEEYIEPWPERRPDGNRNSLIMGVDFGKSGSSNDKTVIQILEKTKDGRMVHRFSKVLDRRQFTDFPAQAAEVARIALTFDVTKVVCDETGLGLGIVPLIRRYAPNKVIDGITFSADIKADMVMNIKSMMERDVIWLMQDDKELFHEIHNMQATPLPSGKIRYHGEPHDDRFWALALAAKEGTYRHFAMYTVEDLLRGDI